MRLNEAGRVHFVGIGGAGMSAIAKVLLERGVEVSGSDLKVSRAAMVLEAMGADISLGHRGENVDGADAVVVSTAIGPRNPEVLRAEELGIEVMLRGRALAALMNGSRSIVVSGTHGKTTTTSMIVTIARSAGLDPTYLIGAGLNDVGTNARAGEDDLWIAEADESDGSFLWLEPHIAVVTNIEMDHHDRWASLQELRKAFDDFIAGGDPAGSVVFPAEDEEMAATVRSTDRTAITFGPGGSVDASEVESARDGGVDFALVTQQGSFPVSLRVPGRHNVSNALAAAAACLGAGIEAAAVAEGLGAYRGVERRFQLRGTAGGVAVIDDYAHHPTEIRATLEAARSGPWRRLIAVFQPHRFSRTAALWDQFGESFEEADRVVLMDVYGAGEDPVPGVSGKLIADSVCTHFPGRAVAYFPHRYEMLEYLRSVTKPGDALLTLGAGDITTVGEEFIARADEVQP